VLDFSSELKMKTISIYDTTLRDGTQAEGVSLSLLDKIHIAQRLAEIGIDLIEGGFPYSNPKDQEFFQRMRGTPLHGARLALSA
jgi:2-isopropylmalate synthase